MHGTSAPVVGPRVRQLQVQGIHYQIANCVENVNSSVLRTRKDYSK